MKLHFVQKKLTDSLCSEDLRFSNSFSFVRHEQKQHRKQVSASTLITSELSSSLIFSILICFSLELFSNFRLSCFNSFKISFGSLINFSTSLNLCSFLSIVISQFDISVFSSIICFPHFSASPLSKRELSFRLLFLSSYQHTFLFCNLH